MNEKDVTIIEVGTLDEEFAKKFSKRWAVQWSNGSLIDCDTEEEACAIQRKARICHGLEPMTGKIKMDRKSIPLNKILQEFHCPLCHNENTVCIDELIEIGTPHCIQCNYDEMETVGDSYIETLPENIINEMRLLTNRITKNYQADFVRDEKTFQDCCDSFIWGCRENGTDLLLMPKGLSEKPCNTNIIWINGEDDKRSEEIRYFDGYSLEKITPEQATRIWDDYCEDDSHG